MSEAFAAGGIWMYVITVFGVVFYALLVTQFVRARTINFVPVLVGVLAALVMAGPLGTFVGLQQAGMALGSHPADQSAMLLGQATGIAHITSAYSFLLGLPGAIALGFAAQRARRRSEGAALRPAGV